MIQFKLRNEEGLHCRFCKDRAYFRNMGNKIKINDLFETSPIKGIVCKNCKAHLEEYMR